MLRETLTDESTISIHAPREGGDRFQFPQPNWTMISIHAPREGGDGGTRRRSTGKAKISIHAPREGGDARKSAADVPAFAISIHAPREGGDILVLQLLLLRAVFQSTPPARGATRR